MKTLQFVFLEGERERGREGRREGERRGGEKRFRNKLRYASKRMQQFVKFVCRFLLTNRATLLWFASGFVREVSGYGLRHFLPNAPRFLPNRRNLANVLHFSRQNARIEALYKTVHCDAAIKVRHFWWEKSGAHAAMFSSVDAARLLHSFRRSPYIM